MNVNYYSYMIALADSSSISAAAKKLFMTQSALTKCIKRMEDEFGGALIERNTMPLQLTSAGTVFLEYAKKYMDLEREMLDRMGVAMQQQKGCIRIVSTIRGGWFLGKRIGPFLKQYPNIRLELLEESAAECEMALIREDADFVVYTDPVLNEQIEYVPLKKEKLVFIVPQNHPLVQNVDVSENSLEHPLVLELSMLRNQKFLLSTENHSIYFTEKQFLDRNQLQPEKPIRVDYINMRYAMACGGAGITIVPEETVRRNEGVPRPVFCTVRGNELYRNIILARKKGRRMTAAEDCFWNYVIANSYGENA